MALSQGAGEGPPRDNLFGVQPIPTLVQSFHRPGWVYEEKVDGWRIIA
jgi:hypothetical protein